MSVVSRQFGRTMVVVAGLVLPACDQLPTSPDPSAGPTQRAMTLGDWTRSGYATRTCRIALDEIEALGANRVVFLANAYQETATSSRLERDGSATDLDAFRTATTWAGQRDLLPVLKLHVDVRDGTWRGELDPADRVAWFDDYRAFVVDCAVAAAETDVATLVIGTELARLSREEFAWREIIAETRAVYDGEVLYAASWDELERVPFWDALDAIGVDFYGPVASRPDPTRFEILVGWQPWLERLDRLRRAVGKDVVFTELGYASRDGAGMEPSDYESSAVADAQEQADLYAAALIALSDATWVRGVYWWNWELGVAGGPDHDGYTPRGKPAEEVLCEAWSGEGS